ncbi:hypothetical protein Kpol_1058p56 [Vanderwaltozyma polyspora DSM 70294]|uniref:Ketoreductase (KR) domain-containing protein n=1 Tax=Vanderwaltozyma polyspora (strain ATCC 22028 / DSM 70294 / BCRC 21397 / CBS 2163 / NBRC 10782 / NRRL Y-8283 / UCD 57-17) TaxID=436907 RepID=A7TJU0_VANPO|nr:uncharacterized protein Kpol_1058p56 [Vanderwaltozyma polyspora DSM 70294]EDO17519.1 hypothetical protein Kpol_1058p56 [Vanderwaltozyma polyspora DSM 70294]
MMFTMKKDTSFTYEQKNFDDCDFSQVNAAVIGGTNGLGRAISNAIASKGAKVEVVGRTFRDENSDIKFIKADLSSMKEAKKVVNQLDAENLTHLILTTGIIPNPKRQETDEGLEKDMAISYLSRYVILREIASKLGKNLPASSPKPRIFIMGFPGNNEVGTLEDLNFEKNYEAWKAHMSTVAGNESLVLDAKDRYPKLNVFGLNPGIVRTEIRNNYFGGGIMSSIIENVIGWFTYSPEQYAKNISPVLISPAIENRSGTMFNNKAEAILPSSGLTTDYVKQFLNVSNELIKKVGVTVPE